MLPESVEMEYQQHMYTPTHVKRGKASLTQKNAQPKVYQAAKLSQFWSMPLNVTRVYEEAVNAEGANATADKIWPLEHPNNENMIEISAALIKKQGDYPEFWTNNHSFISAMESFYSHTRKKNSKDLL